MKQTVVIFLLCLSINSFSQQKRITFFDQTIFGYLNTDMSEARSGNYGTLRKYFVPFRINKYFITNHNIKKISIVNYNCIVNKITQLLDTLSINRYEMIYDRVGNKIEEYSFNFKRRNDSIITIDSLFKRKSYFVDNKHYQTISHDFTYEPNYKEYDSSYENVRYDTSSTYYLKDKQIRTEQFYAIGFNKKRYSRLTDTLEIYYKDGIVISESIRKFNGIGNYKSFYSYVNNKLSYEYSVHNNIADTFGRFVYNKADQLININNHIIFKYKDNNLVELNWKKNTQTNYGDENFTYFYDEKGFLLKIYCDNPIINKVYSPPSGNYRYFEYEFY